MSLPVGQPRFWVESRRTAKHANGVWYRADTMEEAINLKEFFNMIGNRCVIIHEWVGLMYVPVAGTEGQVQLMAVPFQQ